MFMKFEEISRTNGVNILDKEAVLNAISSSDAQIILHMAAKTHVDGCELDKVRDKEILGFSNSQSNGREHGLKSKQLGRTCLRYAQNIVRLVKNKKEIV